MPRGPWTGYGRFCPLARSLDVLGDRWTLVIAQELLKRPSRYGELVDRLPGIGTSLLADRLRRLEAAGVVMRRPGPVGEGFVYELTERGRALEEPLTALRRWGVQFLFDPSADGHADQRFDVSYVAGIEAAEDGVFELLIDGRPSTFYFADGELRQETGATATAELVVGTTSAFLDRWAAGDVDWEGGVSAGEVVVDGPAESWRRWLASTGYLRSYEPETANARAS